ncbi:hypothetical protein BT96DRAFT_982771 [Gymnopus androsaceus JB14]|uniref:Uncharacterized protein n=1 Tax=Gymnopus androsaceus JB14 TaxID=1447944 RepID=A0A6A4GBN1_9AGAR|nr:hypothetical protein BT96DRAFT_982771 [Gymnopus androsaceus JB14]
MASNWKLVFTVYEPDCTKSKSNTPLQVPCEPLKLNAPSESEKWRGKSSAGMGTNRLTFIIVGGVGIIFGLGNRTSLFIVDGGCKVFKVFFIGKTTQLSMLGKGIGVCQVVANMSREQNIIGCTSPDDLDRIERTDNDLSDNGEDRG